MKIQREDIMFMAVGATLGAFGLWLITHSWLAAVAGAVSGAGGGVAAGFAFALPSRLAARCGPILAAAEP